MKVHILFKGGASIDVDIDEFEKGVSVVTGGLTSFKWTTPEDFTKKLSYINVNEVVAIVRVR